MTLDHHHQIDLILKQVPLLILNRAPTVFVHLLDSVRQSWSGTLTGNSRSYISVLVVVPWFLCRWG
ncbi:hypothetical protein Hanom_Chr12g01092011 [Helianthus anomalus]